MAYAQYRGSSVSYDAVQGRNIVKEMVNRYSTRDLHANLKSEFG